MFGKIFGSTGLKNKKSAKECGQIKENYFKDYIFKKYLDSEDSLILSRNIKVPLNSKNTNICMIGGSGSQKTYAFTEPNLMQANSSYLVADRFLKTYSKLSQFLSSLGYEIRVVDLAEVEDLKGMTGYTKDRYNPFEYLYSLEDIDILTETIILNTKPIYNLEYFQSLDKMLLNILISYIHFSMPKDAQSFASLLKLLKSCSKSKSLNEIESFCKASNNSLKNKFEKFKEIVGENQENVFNSCLGRLKIFENEALLELTSNDNLELDKISDRKTAIFLNLFEGDDDFSLISAMLYTQTINILRDYAENTAEFSQIITSKGEVIKTFKAKDKEDSLNKKEEALEFLNKAKNAEIVLNNSLSRFEARTKDGELILFRRQEFDARKALSDLLEYEKVVENKELNGGAGRKLPIHTTIFSKEFYRIGIIPDLALNMNKLIDRNISIIISLLYLDILRNSYKNSWEEILKGCGVILFMGGCGCRPKDGEKLIEIVNEEKNRSTIIKNDIPKSESEIDTMFMIFREKCLVIIKSKIVCIDEKYNPSSNKNYECAKKLSLTEAF